MGPRGTEWDREGQRRTETQGENEAEGVLYEPRGRKERNTRVGSGETLLKRVGIAVLCLRGRTLRVRWFLAFSDRTTATDRRPAYAQHERKSIVNEPLVLSRSHAFRTRAHRPGRRDTNGGWYSTEEPSRAARPTRFARLRRPFLPLALSLRPSHARPTPSGSVAPPRRSVRLPVLRQLAPSPNRVGQEGARDEPLFGQWSPPSARYYTRLCESLYDPPTPLCLGPPFANDPRSRSSHVPAAPAMEYAFRNRDRKSLRRAICVPRADQFDATREWKFVRAAFASIFVHLATRFLLPLAKIMLGRSTLTSGRKFNSFG